MLIGIMYAGRNEEGTKDDIVFYGMNAYWDPLDMQLPNLPEGRSCSKHQWENP